MSRARKLILELQVNIDKPIAADMTLAGRWYGGEVSPPLISEFHVLSEIV